MRGRKPTPTARRILEGNPSKRPLNTDEPQPAALAVSPEAPPEELEGQPTALREWARLSPVLQQARQITEADRSALVAVCLEWARYIDATKMIAKTGLIIKAPSGYPISNPYLSIATKALAGCNRLWPELGLTPSSRSRVSTTTGPAVDPFTEFDTVAPLPPAASTKH